MIIIKLNMHLGYLNLQKFRFCPIAANVTNRIHTKMISIKNTKFLKFKPKSLSSVLLLGLKTQYFE